MKQIFFTILFFTIFLSSCSSPESKAKKLIKQNLFETLHDYSSYEPVSFSKIDSAFTTLEDDTEIIALLEEVDKSNKKGREALDIMENWEGSTTEYGIKRFINAKMDLDHSVIYSKMLIKAADSIEAVFKPEFIGYKMVHKYRSKTLAGNSKLSEMTFYFDEEISNILKTKENE